jgi:hypothetical protein
MGKKDDAGLCHSLKRWLLRHKVVLCSIGILTVTTIVLSLTFFSIPIHQQQQQQTSTKKKETEKRPALSGTTTWAPAGGAASTPTSSGSSKCRWRPEPLQGKCDSIRPTPDSQAYTTAGDCEAACCEAEACLAFQYRAKEGCMWGHVDVRLGAEKDGPTAWCEPRAPAKWHGQWVKSQDGDGAPVPRACDGAGWNPDELTGQCFGLGSRRPILDHTPEACRDACCTDPDGCRIWQWTVGAGCFYHTTGFSCQEANPLDLEPFVGKRKVQMDRSYTPHAYSEDFADMAGS